MTVAVEPPSPTDGSPTTDLAESRRDLQRTKTVPARRAHSSTDVADAPDNDYRRRQPSPGFGGTDANSEPRRGSKNQTERLNPASLGELDNAEEDGDGDVSHTSCRIYRVRSFTTKKGGSVVNRGDSIKICGSGGRRASQLVITPTNDAELLGGALQAPSQRSSLRRRSATCLTSGFGSKLQPEVVGIGVSQSRRHSFIIRQPAGSDVGGLGRRTSLRGSDRRTTSPSDGGVMYRVELTLGQNSVRRSFTERLSGADATDQSTARPNDGVDETGNLTNDVEDDNDDEEDEEDGDVSVYKVMVLGSHGVGKTTLVQQLLTSEYLANADDEQGQSASLRY